MPRGGSEVGPEGQGTADRDQDRRLESLPDSEGQVFIKTDYLGVQFKQVTVSILRP